MSPGVLAGVVGDVIGLVEVVGLSCVSVITTPFSPVLTSCGIICLYLSQSIDHL